MRCSNGDDLVHPGSLLRTATKNHTNNMLLNCCYAIIYSVTTQIEKIKTLLSFEQSFSFSFSISRGIQTQKCFRDSLPANGDRQPNVKVRLSQEVPAETFYCFLLFSPTL